MLCDDGMFLAGLALHDEVPTVLYLSLSAHFCLSCLVSVYPDCKLLVLCPEALSVRRQDPALSDPRQVCVPPIPLLAHGTPQLDDSLLLIITTHFKELNVRNGPWQRVAVARGFVGAKGLRLQPCSIHSLFANIINKRNDRVSRQGSLVFSPRSLVGRS